MTSKVQECFATTNGTKKKKRTITTTHVYNENRLLANGFNNRISY